MKRVIGMGIHRTFAGWCSGGTAGYGGMAEST